MKLSKTLVMESLGVGARLSDNVVALFGDEEQTPRLKRTPRGLAEGRRGPRPAVDGPRSPPNPPAPRTNRVARVVNSGPSASATTPSQPRTAADGAWTFDRARSTAGAVRVNGSDSTLSALLVSDWAENASVTKCR